MALTWRNVDAPQGLNQAAGQVQQSFRDVANSLKDVGQNFVDMKSNDAMAALEARLAQEQQLGNVDQMAAMDAGQLRGATSGWIDTKQAREQILGRQSQLVDQTLGSAREALAAGNYDVASQLEQQLRGRADVDTSGLITDINTVNRNNLINQFRQQYTAGDIAGGSATLDQIQQDKTFDSSSLVQELQNEKFSRDLDAAYESGNFEAVNAVTAEQREALRQAQLQKDLVNNDIAGARSRVRNDAELRTVEQRATRLAVNSFGQTVAGLWDKLNTSADIKDFRDTKKTMEGQMLDAILSAPSEARQEMLQVATMVQQSAAAEEVRRTSVPPQIKARAEKALQDLPTVIGFELAPLRNEIETEKARLRGTVGENIVSSIGPATLDAPATGNNLATAYKALADAGVNTEELQYIIRKGEINLSDYNVGALINMALSTQIENEWLTFGDWASDRGKNAKARLDEFMASGKKGLNLDLVFRNLDTSLKQLEYNLMTEGEKLITGMTTAHQGKTEVPTEEAFKIDARTVIGLAKQTENNTFAQLSEQLATLNGRSTKKEPEGGGKPDPSPSFDPDPNNKSPSGGTPTTVTWQPLNSQFVANALKATDADLVKAEARLAQLTQAQSRIGSGSLTGVSDARLREQEREVERLKKLREQQKLILSQNQ